MPGSSFFIMRSIKYFSCLIVLFITIALKAQRDTAHIFSASVNAVIVNNAAYGDKHKEHYNGVAELYTANSIKNAFVPSYAGLNLEHIFSGDSGTYSWNTYECRLAPIQIIKLSDSKSELRQSRTLNWPLQSNILFEIKGNAIDFTYTGIPLEDAWKKHGYIGLFFASYIYEPEQRGIYFIGISKGNNRVRWIYNLPASHGIQANHRQADSKFYPPMDTAGFPKTLALIKGVSDFEYAYPFYYGVRDGNVLIMMFEKPEDGEINFAQSPDGASEKDPAWDFIYYQKKYQVGKPFAFRGRMVYKKFQGQVDVIKTYEEWSKKKVVRPHR